MRICRSCLIVQLPEYVSPDEIFREYAYFSSFSDSWVEHARQFADTMIDLLGLGPESRVVEVASNDGYLLRHFVARGVPVLGVDPARNVAEAARAQDVPIVAEFFGVPLAESLLATNGPADLIVANNVYAHVPDLYAHGPDLHDLTGGFAVLPAPGGTLSIEFPHLVRLVEGNQFDTIYHEHFRVGGMAGTAGTDRQRRSLPGPGPIARQATSLARNAVHRDNA
ncbi:MAG TPA: methyltransferase domain-containing protein [Candidatus Limnocylindrales bacterium]